MNIDFKETIWYRIPIDSTLIDENKLVKALKDKEVTTAVQLLEFIHDETNDIVNGSYLYDSAEEISDKEAKGSATIELHNDNGKIIFTNDESK